MVIHILCFDFNISTQIICLLKIFASMGYQQFQYVSSYHIKNPLQIHHLFTIYNCYFDILISKIIFLSFLSALSKLKLFKNLLTKFNSLIVTFCYHFRYIELEIGLFVDLIQLLSIFWKFGFSFFIFSFNFYLSLKLFSSFLINLCLSLLYSTCYASYSSSFIPPNKGINMFFQLLYLSYSFQLYFDYLIFLLSKRLSSTSSSPLSLISFNFYIVYCIDPQASLSFTSFYSLKKGSSLIFCWTDSSLILYSSVQSFVWKILFAPDTQMYSQFQGSVRTTNFWTHWGHFILNQQILVEWKLATQVLMALNLTPLATMFWQDQHLT